MINILQTQGILETHFAPASLALSFHRSAPKTPISLSLPRRATKRVVGRKRPAPPRRRVAVADKRRRALRELKRMRIPLRSLPIRAGYPSIYENGAAAGGVSPRRALSFLCRRFLSENAAAIESRACRVLSSSSGRASPPRDKTSTVLSQKRSLARPALVPLIITR